FDEKQMKVGRRLAMKVLNASKFVLADPEHFGLGAGDRDRIAARVTEPIDLSMLTGLRSVIAEATSHFDAYDYTGALEVTERFFWSFCDNYLELVKQRAHRDDSAGASARSAFAFALHAQLRLLAPFLPFATEEVWSWWQDGSIHRADWPQTQDIPTSDQDPAMLDAATDVLAGLRGAKSVATVGMKTEIVAANVTGPRASWDAAATALDDIKHAGRVSGDVAFTADEDAEQLHVEATLAD